MQMEDEELPSESTAQPSFRRKSIRDTTSTKANPAINSSTKVRTDKDRLAPANIIQRNIA